MRLGRDNVWINEVRLLDLRIFLVIGEVVDLVLADSQVEAIALLYREPFGLSVVHVGSDDLLHDLWDFGAVVIGLY